MKYIISFLIVISIFSCKKNNNEGELPPQTIVTNDTSGVTGELTVHTYYFKNEETTPTELNNVDVYLYASYNDIQLDLQSTNNDLAIYRVTENGTNSAYFGYINYGNYYVLGIKEEAGNHYEKTSIVQVRPLRDEQLNLFLELN